MNIQKKEKQLKKFSSKMQASLLLVFCVVILIFLVLIGRLIFLNNKDGERYAKKVLSQQTYVSNVLPYKRGDIVDRNGTVLARSEKVYNLVIDPKFIQEKVKEETPYVEPTINALTSNFDIERTEVEQILSEKKEKRYVILEKGISYDKVDAYNKYVEDIKKSDETMGGNIKGLWFEEEYVRNYPLKTVASDVIGFTSKGNVGNWGIEEYYNEELNGSNGREYGYFDSELNLERTVKPAKNGDTIISTIDANVQKIVENEIYKYNKEVGSKNTAVIVMNPQNGEVIAMASKPSYDLNDPRNLEKFYTKAEIDKMTPEQQLTALNDIWRNFTISDAYEPGSTFKPFTVASSFEEGIVNGTETYVCDGYEEILGVKIRCNKREGHGTITLEQALMLSCNDALMQIVKKEGKQIFSDFVRIFGFGTKTGIDLPGEGSGLVFTKDQLNPIEIATSSFGQGQTVTMIQLASAFSSVINGGYYYKPHVVKKIVSDTGAVVKNVEPTLVKETVSQKTSDTLREYLYETVKTGTAKTAAVEGYAIGGKTGTAEKAPRGKGNYLVSFIGFAPYENPQMVIYVVVDEPNVAMQADSSIATKMASRIMTKILPFLSIYPEDKTATDVATQGATQDVQTTNKAQQSTDKQDAARQNAPSGTQTDNAQ